MKNANNEIDPCSKHFA